MMSDSSDSSEFSNDCAMSSDMDENYSETVNNLDLNMSEELTDTIWNIVKPKKPDNAARQKLTSTPKRNVETKRNSKQLEAEGNPEPSSRPARNGRPVSETSKTSCDETQSANSTVLTGKRGTIIFSPRPSKSGVETRLSRIEEKQDIIINMLKEISRRSTASDKYTRRGQSRVSVPHNIRVAVHDSYTHAVDQGKSWTTETTTQDGKTKFLRYDADVNREMTESILTSVKGIYPSAQDVVIKEGIKRYFTTQRDKQRRIGSGKDNLHRQKMVLYGRKKRKLENRKNALGLKKSWDEEKRANVEKILCMEMMSSEDEMETDDENYLSVKKLPWRSQECESMLKDLDRKANENKSKKARRQELKRVRGTTVSTRPIPKDVQESCPWAFSN